MLFNGKYRIESSRLKEWNYSKPWWYYVTINTKNQFEYFGNVENGKMVLNPIGMLIEEEWLKTKEIRSNVDLDYYVVMPNHFHGIIVLEEKNNVETTGSVVLKNNLFSETTHRVVSTTLKPNSLGSIIGQFKSTCSKKIHKLGKIKFSWQNGFYDRIIRNEKELFQIRKYIEQNPIKWELDKESFENQEL
jgi:REP element-mobilizing transposase RayT